MTHGTFQGKNMVIKRVYFVPYTSENYGNKENPFITKKGTGDNVTSTSKISVLKKNTIAHPCNIIREILE